jgi:hypothetical protein
MTRARGQGLFLTTVPSLSSDTRSKGSAIHSFWDRLSSCASVATMTSDRTTAMGEAVLGHAPIIATFDH